MDSGTGVGLPSAASSSHGMASTHRQESTTSSAGVSRRRITFRPYSLSSASTSAPAPATTNPADGGGESSSAATAVAASGGGTATPAAAAPGTTTAKTTRRWGPWSNAEISVFYDGIKQYGKDFDQVAKLMSRRKMNKDKEQIRNYYFNSFKMLRATAQINEELMADIPRDARELFIVINLFEWKKKSGDAKIDPVKLRQLIFEGSTSFRLKKKKQCVVVRTPVCPALQKLFPSRKQEEPLPTHIVLSLTPRQEVDRSYVEWCGQNPLLKLRIAVNDHLKRVFTLLKMKWIPRLMKYDKERNVDDVPFRLVLYPDKETPVGRVLIKCADEYAPTAFSLNRLKKERSRVAPEEGEEHSNQGDNAAKVNPSAPSQSTECSNTECHPAEVQNWVCTCETNLFVLTETTLRAGLDETNVGDATATELYYLCGMQNEVHLQYATNSTRNRSLEPWKIFVSLITRNYGENLCKILAEGENAEEAKQVMVTVEDRSRKRRTSNAETSSTGPSGTAGSGAGPSSSKISRTASVEVSPTGSAVTALSGTPVTSTSTAAFSSASTAAGTATGGECVVQSENDAFMQQLESLETKRRSKSFFRRSPSKRAPTNYSASVPGLVADFHSTVSPSGSANAAVPPDSGCYFAESSAGMVQPVDFSSISFNGNRHHQPIQTVQRASTDYTTGVNTAAAAPNTQFATQVLTSAGYPVPGYVVVQSSENALSRFANVEVGGRGDEGREDGSCVEVGTSEKTLHELSAMEMAAGGGGSSLDGSSPVKSMSNLPEDVRHSFEMMMQQNSVDYCRNFEQLLSTMDTPKKCQRE